MFNSKSRFAALMEDSSSSSSANKNNNNYSRTTRESRGRQQSAFSVSSSSISSLPLPLKKDVIKEMTFPELETTKSIKQQKQENEKNFAQIVQTAPKVSNTTVEDVIPEGWIRLTRDQNKESININYGNNYKNVQQTSEEVSDELTKTNILQIMNCLSCLHYTRTKEYIHDWGINDWEQQFMCKTDYNFSSSSDSEDEII